VEVLHCNVIKRDIVETWEVIGKRNSFGIGGNKTKDFYIITGVR